MEKLLEALIGLARALDESNTNEEMIDVIANGIASLGSIDEGVLSSQLDAVHEAKKKAVPDCCVCMHPCGKTDDYDMRNLKLDSETVREAKTALIARMKNLTAADVKAKFHDVQYALFLIGYDCADADILNGLLA